MLKNLQPKGVAKTCPTPDDKEEPTSKGRRGDCTTETSHTCWEGRSQTGKELYHTDSATGVRDLS